MADEASTDESDDVYMENGLDLDTGSEDSQSDIDFDVSSPAECKAAFQDRRETAFRRKQTIRRLKRDLDKSRRGKQTRDAKLKELREENAKAKRGPKKPRKTKTTWQAKLAKIFLGTLENQDYQNIYKLSCREENATAHLHPELRLRPPTADELIAQESGGSVAAESERVNNSPPVVFTGEIPLEALVLILQHMVVFEGEPVHFVSRLDPHHQSQKNVVLPPNTTLDENGTGMRFRPLMLVGKGPFSLSFPPSMKWILDLFLVCRKWHYIAYNLFYSMNRFCFSSFGELGRFADPRRAVIQRIQKLSIVWVGNQDVTYPMLKNGKFISRRTHPLYWLNGAIRLKNIEFYVRETDPQYRRSKHEPRGAQIHMARLTKYQPDFRLFRDLYTLQGLKHVRALRGVHDVQFFDYDKFLKHGELRFCVRNTDFVNHINDLTSRDKFIDDFKASQFPMLQPFEKMQFIPTTEEMEAVEDAILIRPEVDEYGRDFVPPNGSSYGPGGMNGGTPDDDDGDDDDGDDDDSDDSNSPHGSGGVNGNAEEHDNDDAHDNYVRSSSGSHGLRGANAASMQGLTGSPAGNADYDSDDEMASVAGDDDEVMGGKEPGGEEIGDYEIVDAEMAYADGEDNGSEDHDDDNEEGVDDLVVLPLAEDYTDHHEHGTDNCAAAPPDEHSSLFVEDNEPIARNTSPPQPRNAFSMTPASDRASELSPVREEPARLSVESNLFVENRSSSAEEERPSWMDVVLEDEEEATSGPDTPNSSDEDEKKEDDLMEGTGEAQETEVQVADDQAAEDQNTDDENAEDQDAEDQDAEDQDAEDQDADDEEMDIEEINHREVIDLSD